MGGEWSLVAFTVTGQLAVGAYIFVGAPLFLFGEVSTTEGGAGVRLEFALAVLGLMAAATGLAFFHLHHPFRSYRTLSNLGRSWLSREVFFEIVFIGTTGLLGFCEWQRIGGVGLVKGLFVLGGLAGVLFLLAMSRLYMLPAIPAWNKASTLVSFFLTSLVLGMSASTLFYSLFSELPRYYRALLAASLLSLLAAFAGAVLMAPEGGLIEGKSRPSLRPPGGGPPFLHALRVIMLLAGSVLLAAALAAGEARVLGVGARPAFLLAAFFLAAAAEVGGRFLFYSLPGRRP